MRFVIIAFLFLGLVFYEMSGGADFDAEATRLARVDAPVAIEQNTLEKVFVETEAALPENVTRIALDLNTIQEVVRPTRTLPTQRARTSEALDTPGIPVSEEPPAEFLPSLVGDSSVDSNNLIDSSVITSVNFNSAAPISLAPAAPQPPTVVADIRSVSGDSVNVRGGPGTDYSVVNRLVLGDEVEVLQDPGEGWVQLRPLNGGPVGWMASFLLNEG